MRRMFKILSVAVCVFVLTACQNVTKPQESTLSQEVTLQTEQIVETETTTALQDPTSVSENQTLQSSIPVISIEEEKKTWKLEGTEQILLEVTAPVVTVESSGFEGLSEYLVKKWPGIGNNDYESMSRNAKEQYESMDVESKRYFGGYAETEEVSVVRCDSNVVSFKCFYYDYQGGVHGNYGYGGVTLDVVSGKEIELDNILLDADAFYEKAVLYIESELWNEFGEGLFSNYKEWVAGTFTGEREVDWYMDSNGIVIIYNIYEVGPYAMGAAQITLPYNIFREYIKPEYIVAG